jgi:signal transduction histidine kinase
MDQQQIADFTRLIQAGIQPDRVLLALLQQMRGGVLVLSVPEGRILLATQQMEHIWGISLSDQSKPPDWEGYHADGRRYQPDEWPFARVLTDGMVAEQEEIEIGKPDGSRALVNIAAAPVPDENGGMKAVIVICLDVSAQRRRYSSRRLLSDATAVLSSTLDRVTTLRNIARLVVPTLADWCIIDLLGRDGKIERVAVEHIDERKARTAEELARRHPAVTGSEVAKVIQTGKSALVPKVTSEILDSFAQGPVHRRILQDLGIQSVMIIPLIARGEPLGAISFVAAESHRVYGPEEMEVAEEMASRAALALENSRLFDESRAATEAKSDFLAVMSHELRTPLTAIIGYAELLQLGVPEPVTPGQHDQAERIEVSARHLLQLIEEILTLVTLDTGEMKVRAESVAVAELIRRAAAIIEPMTRTKNLTFEVDYPTEDLILRTDPDKIVQVLLNLLSNAVKFTEKGGIRLSGQREGEAVRFDVMDTGIGLDAAHVDRIFEPFWQVERPITRRAGGTGLGLTISRRLLDLLGGELHVLSTPGSGSRFSVTVPL